MGFCGSASSITNSSCAFLQEVIAISANKRSASFFNMLVLFF
jgi:hypothetical protein